MKWAKTLSAKCRHNSGGYTMTETLIFLAVSSALFVSAMAFVSGRQERAEFQFGVQEFQNIISDVINDVSTGNYEVPESYTCTLGTGNVNISSGGSTQQGKNYNCIFIGRVMHFAPAGEERDLHIYTVAGRRLGDPVAKTEVTNLGEAWPTVSPINIKRMQIPVGLAIKSVKIGSAPSGSSVGVFTNFPNYGGNSLLESGARNADIIAISTAAPGLNRSEADTISDIQSNVATSPKNPAEGVTVCVENSAGTLYANLSIGGDSRRSSTKLDIQSGVCN
jgi:hypothetical protein